MLHQFLIPNSGMTLQDLNHNYKEPYNYADNLSVIETKDGSISLHARKVNFTHPVKKEEISITAPIPKKGIWKHC